MSVLSQIAEIELGTVSVHTSSNGGHPPEFWAEALVDRLFGITANSAPHIRQQAEAYKEQMMIVIVKHMMKAILSDRNTVATWVENGGEVGSAEAAAKIRQLRGAVPNRQV